MSYFLAHSRFPQANLLAASALAGSLLLTACNDQPNQVEQAQKSIKHKAVEPNCIGVSVKAVSGNKEAYTVSPILKGNFLVASHVVTYLQSPNGTETPPVYVNTLNKDTGSPVNNGNGEPLIASRGLSILIGLDAASHVPAVLAMQDYQNQKPVFDNAYDFQPIADIPTVTCPSTDLAALAFHN